MMTNSLLRVTVDATCYIPASPLLFVIIKISIHRVKHRWYLYWYKYIT